MRCCNLDKKHIISPEYPSELYYPLEKLSSTMWGGTDLYAFTAIQKYLYEIIDFDCIESIEELYALTLAGLYIKKYCDKS